MLYYRLGMFMYLESNMCPRIIYFLIVLKYISCNIETVEVNFDNDVVLGKIETTFFKEKSYFSFKGVPYAEPPIGDLRFQSPKPYKGREGTLNIFEETPTCMQFNVRMRNGETIGVSGSEDCLYLSIFTPALEGYYPVVVFEFNDNFATGFNGTRTYSPDFFIEEDVIVVNINHRLGLFGYLTTEDETIPGNLGIRDFILGLQWIQENISKFGGDPKRVTLMGSRGGASLANVLLYSKQAKDLFHAVIMQSGSVFEPIYFSGEPRSKAFQFGREFNIITEDSKTLLKELQKIDAEQLLMKEVHIFDDNLKETQRNGIIFTPTIEGNIDDAILTIQPENSNTINDVPIIIGFNSREGLDSTAHFIHKPRFFNDVAHDIAMHLPLRLGFRFDPNSDIYKKANREIYDFYYGEDKVVDAYNILDYAVYIGDTLHHYPIDFTVKKLVKLIDSPIYYYIFDFKGSLNENFLDLIRISMFSLEHWGATVTDELCYLHLCSRIRRNYEELRELVSEQPEIKVLKKMVRMWTNFAKTRNPTPELPDNILKNLSWKAVDKQTPEINYLHINNRLQMKVNPLGERGKFWDEFIAKYTKMAVDGVVKDEMRDEL